MNSGFYEAIAIAVIGVLIALSVIRFTAAFYKNPLKAVQLIRLDKNSNLYFLDMILVRAKKKNEVPKA